MSRKIAIRNFQEDVPFPDHEAVTMEDRFTLRPAIYCSMMAINSEAIRNFWQKPMAFNDAQDSHCLSQAT